MAESNNILYFDCSSGISGDMVVATLVDLGVDKDIVIRGIESLGIDGYNIVFSKVVKDRHEMTDFDVILGETECGERNLEKVIDIIDTSNIPSGAKKYAKTIFRIAAEAQAKAHGINVEDVTFHEKGAVDSIIDIVSASICIDALSPDRVVFSRISEGTGWTKYRFGYLPVPCPAVKNIVDRFRHLTLKVTDNNGEMITPTGAAIAAGVGSEMDIDDRYEVVNTGRGAGKRKGLARGYMEAQLLCAAGGKL